MHKVTRATMLIAAVAALFYTAYTYKKYRIAPAIALQDLEVLDAQGMKVKVRPRPGRPLIVVFYASWCHDCARELPKLNRALADSLKGADVAAITDEGIPSMVRYREQNKFAFTFYTLQNDFDRYGIYAIPTVYILNPKGETIFEKVGDVDWSSPDLLLKTKG